MWGLIGLQPVPTQAELAERTEGIREAMLEVLGEQGAVLRPVVRRRLQYAQDVEALWYLRSDWMAAVSATQGEYAAAEQVRHIDVMFEGLLPDGLQSRPGGMSHYGSSRH